MTTQIHPNRNRKSINNNTPFSHFYKKPQILLLIISAMATSLFLFYSFLFFSLFSPSLTKTTPSPEIWRACRATRHPDTCQSMLAQSGCGAHSSSAVDMVQSALEVSTQNLNSGRAMVRAILDSSAHNPNRSRAAQTCLEVLGYAAHRSFAAGNALSRGRLRDARAWASAALSYQYGCWSGLKYVNDTSFVNQTMSFFDSTLILSTSNALSMMRALDALGDDTSLWTPPRTERDGFWEPVVESGSGLSKFGSLMGLTADVTVCKEGGEVCYETVQDAVNAAPDDLPAGKKFVIRIKEGVYEEIVRVPFKKKNVVFLGDGMGKTVITGSLNTGLLGINTYHTATVGVLGDGFMASSLTIQNTASAGAHQAVAFRSDSDFTYVENCEFLGNQDTLYAHSLRQLYKSCHIEGNVDFIFGNAAAIFKNCTILVRPQQANPEKGETNAISAHGRTDPGETTGFAFLGCLINGTNEYMALYHSKPGRHRNYLGRPWKLYSRTVYINCTMETLVSPDGWLPWSGDFALSTLYYGEFGNSGPGANLSNRVPWSRQIPVEHISTYSVQNFLQGDEWITSIS